MDLETYLDALIVHNQDPDDVVQINLPVVDFIGLLKNNLVDYWPKRSPYNEDEPIATIIGTRINKRGVDVRSFETKDGKKVEF